MAELKRKTLCAHYKCLTTIADLAETFFYEESLMLKFQDTHILLSAKEFKLASILFSQKGKTVSREELLSQLEIESEGRALDVLLHALRKKLEPTNINIKNVRGIGFIWI